MAALKTETQIGLYSYLQIVIFSVGLNRTAVSNCSKTVCILHFACMLHRYLLYELSFFTS